MIICRLFWVWFTRYRTTIYACVFYYLSLLHLFIIKWLLIRPLSLCFQAILFYEKIKNDYHYKNMLDLSYKFQNGVALSNPFSMNPKGQVNPNTNIWVSFEVAQRFSARNVCLVVTPYRYPSFVCFEFCPKTFRTLILRSLVVVSRNWVADKNVCWIIQTKINK